MRPIILMVSVVCLVVSYFLLPTINLGAGYRAPTSYSERPDTLALPSFTDASFERVTLKRFVNVGDTLGFVLRDRYRDVRDSLEAFAKTSIIPNEFGLLPLEFTKELSEMIKPLKEANQLTQQKTRPVVRGVEREYLTSEIMGAEDAATELLGRLSHLVDAGKRDSQEAKTIQALLGEKEAFIDAAKRKLAKKETIEVASKSSMSDKAISLTEDQRARVLALSKRLPIDTQRVYAPIAGRYYRPDEGVGYIIEPSEQIGLKDDIEATTSTAGYVLKSIGIPVLWSTAERLDSVSQTGATSAEHLEVSIH